MSARDGVQRVFLAAGIPAAAGDRLAEIVDALREERWARAVRWLPASGLHLTLRFVGDVDAGQLADLRAEVARAASGLPAARGLFGDVRLFPTARRPRVVAVEIGQADGLARIAGALDDAVVATGLPAEPRPLRPHVTLGRIKQGARGLPSLAVPSGAGALPVERVTLYRSDLEPSGARYTVIDRFPLTAAS